MAETDIEEPRLDAEELMHLAMKAMRQNRDEDALLFLKHAIAQTPQDGRLHYLLGALHAELGMAERAISEIERATELNPELSVAHFQLGLLHVASGELQRAEQSWAPLDRLPEDNVIKLFKDGMSRFLQDDYAEAITLLSKGIALNEASEALNEEMERVLAQAVEAQQEAQQEREPATPKAPAKPKPAPREPQHVLLSGYRKQESKDQPKKNG